MYHFSLNSYYPLYVLFLLTTQTTYTLIFCTLCIGVNTGVLTTFRSDNINGAGAGAFVFAYAVPVMTIQARASQPQPSPQQPSAWAPGLRGTYYCWNHYILCKYRRRTCSMPCVSGKVNYMSTAKYSSCVDDTMFITLNAHLFY